MKVRQPNFSLKGIWLWAKLKAGLLSLIHWPWDACNRHKHIQETHNESAGNSHLRTHATQLNNTLHETMSVQTEEGSLRTDTVRRWPTEALRKTKPFDSARAGETRRVELQHSKWSEDLFLTKLEVLLGRQTKTFWCIIFHLCLLCTQCLLEWD